MEAGAQAAPTGTGGGGPALPAWLLGLIPACSDAAAVEEPSSALWMP